ncbi:MAG: hypothetical protein ACJAWF_003720, partial [Candidatus Azotimanducaceae bacterium]
MMSPKQVINALVFTSLFAAGVAFATVPEVAVGPLKPMPEHANTTRNIVDALASRHYVSTLLD